MPIAPAAGPAWSVPVPATTPLADTAHRLQPIHHTFAFALESSGSGWSALADVTDARVRGWLDQLTETTGGHRNVAASYLVLGLTGCVATPLMAAFLLHRRGLPVDGPHASVRLDGSRFDLLALPSGDVDVLPGDPAAAGAGAVVVDEHALASRVARRLHAVMAPVIEAVRRHAPYGERPMWSSVADRLAGPAVLAANLGGSHAHHGWQQTQSIIDHLASLGASIHRRPRLLEVPWSGGSAVSTVKGTCCLKYLECGLRPRDAAERPHDYCGGCPYVSDDVRVAKRRAALEAGPR